LWMECTPGNGQGLGCWIGSLAGVLILELEAPVPECWMEPAFVVDLVDEVRKRMNDVGENREVAQSYPTANIKAG